MPGINRHDRAAFLWSWCPASIAGLTILEETMASSLEPWSSQARLVSPSPLIDETQQHQSTYHSERAEPPKTFNSRSPTTNQWSPNIGLSSRHHPPSSSQMNFHDRPNHLRPSTAAVRLQINDRQILAYPAICHDSHWLAIPRGPEGTELPWSLPMAVIWR
jgi:hypothetical protein